MWWVVTFGATIAVSPGPALTAAVLRIRSVLTYGAAICQHTPGRAINMARTRNRRAVAKPDPPLQYGDSSDDVAAVARVGQCHSEALRSRRHHSARIAFRDGRQGVGG